MSKEVVRKWKIESKTTLGVWYEVTQYSDDTYDCSCPGFIHRRPVEGCKHIKEIKHNPNGGDQIGNVKVDILPGRVREVTRLDAKTIYHPLIPFPVSIPLLATIVYDLLELGVGIGQIRAELTCVPKSWTIQSIQEYIKKHGRYVLPEQSVLSTISAE